MVLCIDKPWQPREEAAKLPGQLGVFELADPSGKVLFIGVADARSLFGLRSAVGEAFETVAGAVQFRVESTSSYHTRYRELLMVYQADQGALPAANAPMRLGRLHP
ncbi:MAG: hypothetical protein FJ194_01445 [Gammaproteobacteria bacterium]|nr:hypothetical protein [Gammaproteobacteria bacterium]